MNLYDKLRLLKEVRNLISYVFTSSAAYDAWYTGLQKVRSELISDAVLKDGVKLDWEIMNHEHL